MTLRKMRSWRKKKNKDICDNQLKEEVTVAVIGEGCVGKSALVARYLSNSFMEYYDPSIEDIYSKYDQVLDGHVLRRLCIIDTAGQVEYRPLLDQTLRESEVFIFAYRLMEPEDRTEGDPPMVLFSSLYEKLNELKERQLIIFVGTKADLFSGDPESTEVAAFARRNGFPHIVTSALNSLNVEEPFLLAGKLALGLENLPNPVVRVKRANKVL
jgi:small GTP-binding protein